MRLLPSFSLLASTLSLFALVAVHASSFERDPLSTISHLTNATIHTPSHRVHAHSKFDVSFTAHDRRVKLSLEPNHDLIGHDTLVTYLDGEGNIARTEDIKKSEHRVFKGVAWIDRSRSLEEEESWERAGWARLFVHRDGKTPVFEGAFSIDHRHWHVQKRDNYLATKRVDDPSVEKGEGMIVWRDQDTQTAHQELKRDGAESKSCGHDQLKFNTNPQHPLHKRSMFRDNGYWTENVNNIFGISKRQSDTPGGQGNGGATNLASTVGNTQGCPTSRKVALVGVAVDCNYRQTFDTDEAMRTNILAQFNTASELYERTFNITLGVANLTIIDQGSSRSCPGSPPSTAPWDRVCSSDFNIQARLNAFSGWRGQQTNDGRSHWTLLSNCPTGAAVGLAWLGQACVQRSLQTADSETVSGANVVVKTSQEWQVIAHETGHTFGAVHDCENDTCADGTVQEQQCCPLQSLQNCDANGRFIMNPSTGSGITDFSPCSVGNICSAFNTRSVVSECFTNNRDVTVITDQQCGNGIVEEGEQCDCGGAEGCGQNSCCDPTTCRFINNAVCDDSNEECCQNCQFATTQRVCRASTGVCDPEERCTGSDPYCPDDTTTPDGQGCGNGLTCASGQCTSRDQQCRSLMGSFTQNNDTYACQQYQSSCVVWCGSPEFGSNSCRGLRQNFLDGTPCGGGGNCDNGQCVGSSAGEEIRSWIERNKTLVIGIGAGVGGLILICILMSIIRCCRRKKVPKRPRGGPPNRFPPNRFPMQHGQGPHQRYGSQGVNGSGVPLMTSAPTGQQWGNGQRGSPTSPHEGWNGPMPPPMYQRQQSIRYA